MLKKTKTWDEGALFTIVAIKGASLHVIRAGSRTPRLPAELNLEGIQWQFTHAKTSQLDSLIVDEELDGIDYVGREVQMLRALNHWKNNWKIGDVYTVVGKKGMLLHMVKGRSSEE